MNKIDNYNEFSIKKWAYEYIKIPDNIQGLNSYEDAKEELDYFFEYEYPKMKDSFYLYRVLQVENKKDINKSKLGNHYIHPDYLQRIYEKPWYELINLVIEDSSKLFLVKCLTNHGDVNWESTIENRMNYPREFEITLINNPKIIEIEEINKDKNNLFSDLNNSSSSLIFIISSLTPITAFSKSETIISGSITE